MKKMNGILKAILLYLLVIPIASLAQLPIVTKDPTQFDKFIVKPAIEWAAYLTDTIRFTGNNLSEILRNRFDGETIEVSTPVTARTNGTNKITYSKKEEIISAYPSIRDQLPSQYFDSLTYNLLEAVQIIYIEKGKLLSYVPWVSPKFSVITASGIHLGYADYFSGAFNYKRNFSASSHDKIIELGKTKKKILVDSIPSYNMLKSLFGKNLVEALWPSITSDRFDIFSVNGNKKLEGKNLITGIVSDTVMIPVYDSTGNIVASKKLYAEPILPKDITAIELSQNWFYDFTKNVVYNNISDMLLFASPLNTGETKGESLPVLKIVFK